MKKFTAPALGVSLAAVTLAAVHLPSGALAMESEMGTAMGNDVVIGGFYEFGWSSLNDGFKGTSDDAQTYGNGELEIEFGAATDTGLEYGVGIGLILADFTHNESHGADGEATNSDAVSIFVGGDFGDFVFGHTADAYDEFLTWAPTHVGAFSASGHDNIHTPKFDNGTDRQEAGLITFGPYTVEAHDAKLVYYSPGFGGFRFGASVQDDDKADDNPISYGASFETELYGVDLAVTAANWTNSQDYSVTGNDCPEDDSVKCKSSRTSFGLAAGMDAFALTATRTGATEGGEFHEIDKEITELGFGYGVSDALSFGVSHAMSEAEGGTGVGRTDQEGTFTGISGEYNIAPGLYLTLAHNTFDLKDNANTSWNNDGSLINMSVAFYF